MSKYTRLERLPGQEKWLLQRGGHSGEVAVSGGSTEL